jgi:hypothetical protein
MLFLLDRFEGLKLRGKQLVWDGLAGEWQGPSYNLARHCSKGQILPTVCDMFSYPPRPDIIMAHQAHLLLQACSTKYEKWLSSTTSLLTHVILAVKNEIARRCYTREGAGLHGNFLDFDQIKLCSYKSHVS